MSPFAPEYNDAAGGMHIARRHTLRRAVQAAGIPEDIVLGMPRVLLRGDSSLLLENHRGVLEYAPERLRVRTSLGVMTVEGEGLTLTALGDTDLMLTGSIRGVTL